MALPKISDVSTWATGMLGRSDLSTTAIAFAKDVYLTMCGRVPFEALVEKTGDLAIVANTDFYSLSAVDPAVCGIIAVSMKYSSTRYRRLRRSNVRKFEAMRGTAAGEPHSYARWKGGIEFFPCPNSAVYTYRLRYWTYPTIEAIVEDTELVYPLEWQELHQWETLHRLYVRTDQPEKAMALMQPAMVPQGFSPKKKTITEIGIIPRLWNDLLKTIDMREAVDEDFSINPVQLGSYTWR